ncbi:MAG: hypothetical protein MUP49_02990 [Dehalococcoidia bacterium]|nr:hypothetical protein [Dehalococcoidia bacterium]
MLKASEIEHLRSWLLEMQKHWLIYHNHKETSAWLAIAAYGVFIVGLANAGLHVTGNRILLAAFTVLVVAIATGFLLFVRRQLGLRRTGGLLTTTAGRVQTNLFRESFRESLTETDLDRNVIPEEKGSIVWWLLRVRYQKPDGKWPKVFRDEFKRTVKDREGEKNRHLLEAFPQLLIVLGTIAYVVALWLCYCGVE